MPISAILFGGRRSSVVPLVHEAINWSHGVFLGSTMASETTAAATGAVGNLRRDPFAMLPFCGYNMADYWAHWLTFADRMDAEQLPKIFFVNWFRKGPDGKFLWPGFGENSRVLAWIFERCAGRGAATTTPIGRLPAKGAIDTRGLDITDAEWAELFRVDADEWRDEILAIRRALCHLCRSASPAPHRTAQRPRRATAVAAVNKQRGARTVSFGDPCSGTGRPSDG